ncbi:hypothetical protein K492DRAFT_174769 [Lichtheimia hyalospora FSU 10163]|nr:hypothetical protein K492DRAFT_174769 [Lichtheimia hyalospora FSU 10163]
MRKFLSQEISLDLTPNHQNCSLLISVECFWKKLFNLTAFEYHSMFFTLDLETQLWMHFIASGTFVHGTPSSQYAGSSWHQDVSIAYNHSLILLPYHICLVASEMRVLSNGKRYHVSSDMVVS